ncbi:excinuclease ABC subunit UvrC [Prochlorococcus marinus]|uniref:UvrABC system protein C n=1 Tax=Prochlorococcus marinus (strain MIT 9211) TaxID=93059 RepID=UVRC_PROM4|nr:excinuclease ABC subunit UvrC [Prochlorococcus marinus]A9BAF1.1 RecName: Full=UvrABC system protein C; Short=Protein UvrC; AltName: Full=Excinuclease ABC subunit C [Prochlorococcus marinus str. MIT 9211]ABX08813.1 Excinuclease ABC subunit C (UvrC) [Prochlorococcus marinus str. MIT 9211]
MPIIESSQSLLLDKDKLKRILLTIPSEPGCYLMRDKNETLLYIGKSKSLKSRVRSYFNTNNTALSPRISLMVRQVYDIEFILTDSDSEALNLESNLIKEHQPYFNILLKDDKKYPYLCITWSEEYPRIFITRRRRLRNSEDRYYGPYVDVTLLRKTLFLLKKLFPLRQRPRALYKDRTCLNYSINRCPGVCQRLIEPDDYHKTLKKVAMIFEGRTDQLKDLLHKQMLIQSKLQEFEKAAIIRDQIKGIEQLYAAQKMTIPDSTVSRDVLGLSIDSNVCCVQLFQMRAGKLVGRIGFVYNSLELRSELILQKVLEEYYSQIDNVTIPPEILLQSSIPQQSYFEQWLSELRGSQVKIVIPKRKEKAELVKLVKRNADIELERVKDGQSKHLIELEDLTQVLDLAFVPRRIEGYDISHLAGTEVVGSQVVFIEGIPAKQHYRKYAIKSSSISSGHSDDYMALAEVIRRRFRRWSKYKADGLDLTELRNKKLSSLDPLIITDWPDLIMIDGGKGQLKAVEEALRQLGLDSDINVCSLAKRNEEIFVPGSYNKLDTEKNQPGLLLLRRLRDEAHRFAINFHRKKRSLSMKRSQLIDIPGVGPRRIKSLLAHFKSVQAIQLATEKEIASVEGLGTETASIIFKYFNPIERDIV